MPEWLDNLGGLFDFSAACIGESAMLLGGNAGQIDRVAQQADLDRWWGRAAPLFHSFLNLPHPKYVHTLVFGLAEFVTVDPKRTPRWLARLTRAGVEYSLSLESSIEKFALQCLHNVVENNKELLQEQDQALDAFFRVLDDYVKIGSPEALQLTFELDEIFR